MSDISQINIVLIDPSGTTKTTAVVPTDVPMSRLIPVIVEKLGIPQVNPGGNKITYKLRYEKTGDILTENETMRSVIAQEGDVFTLVATMSATDPARPENGLRVRGPRSAYVSAEEEVNYIGGQDNYDELGSPIRTDENIIVIPQSRKSSKPTEIQSQEERVKQTGTIQYDAFISYSHFDWNNVSRVLKDLDQAGLNYWIDRDFTNGQVRFDEAQRSGLANSKVFLLMASSDSLASESVGMEIERAHIQQRQTEGRYRIVVAILDDVKLPSSLGQSHQVDFSRAWQNPQTYQKQISELLDVVRGKQPTQKFTYDVFLTFSHADIEFARRLDADLTKQDLRVWFDDRELTPGTEYEKKIFEGVETSRSVAVIITPESMRSEWVRRIYLRALEIGTLVIPVLLRNAEMPIELADRLWVDVRDSKLYDKAIVIIVETIRGKTPAPQTTPSVQPTTSELPQSSTTVPPQETKPALTTIEELMVEARGLSDTKSKIDLLGFNDYAQALADFIIAKETEKPLTIAIDAAWGMGKTTLMDFLKTRLETYSPRPLTVWFDAWTYHQEESLWAAMVIEMLEQIGKKFTWQQRARLWRDLNWRRFDKRMFASSLLKSAGFILGAIVLGLIATGIASLLNGSVWTLGFKELADYIRFLGGVSLAGLIPVLYTLVKDFLKGVAGPFDLKVGQYIREPDYQARVGFLAKFKKDYEWVVASVAQDQTRPLVVFIDDLDRCAPPKPAEIIEAINLLLDVQNCVFVIGMDSKMVAASLEVKYKDLTAYIGDADDPGGLTLGQRFLEKIIQVNFQIPRADPDKVVKFVDANLGIKEARPVAEPSPEQVQQQEQKLEAGESPKTDTPIEKKAAERAEQNIVVKTFEQSVHIRNALHLALEYLGRNPRKIKRFINNYRLQVLIANRRGLVTTGVIDLNLLAKWLIISTRWPDVASILPANNPFVELLKRARALQAELPDEQAKASLDVLLTNPCLKRSMGSAELMRLLDTMRADDINALPLYQHLAQITQARSGTSTANGSPAAPNPNIPNGTAK